MRLRADVHCYHCGQVSGTWEWLAASKPDQGAFRAPTTAGATATMSKLADLRCMRCAGPVFLDEVEPVIEMPKLTIERPRRGRPPKSAQRLAG